MVITIGCKWCGTTCCEHMILDNYSVLYPKCLVCADEASRVE
jgi:hypothetical protein